MPTEAQGEVTRLLRDVAAGSDEAKNALFAQVYDQLHKTAHRRMKSERLDHSWGATGLVHEVYRHLMEARHDYVFTKDRAYFFRVAARAMHQLLRDHARKRQCRPQGHSAPEGHLLLDEVVAAVESTFKVDLLDLMNALDELQATGEHGPRRHDVIRLRIWSGLTYQQIAEDLGVAVATVERDWLAARAWLYGRLKGGRTND